MPYYLNQTEISIHKTKTNTKYRYNENTGIILQLEKSIGYNPSQERDFQKDRHPNVKGRFGKKNRQCHYKDSFREIIFPIGFDVKGLLP